MPKVVLPNGKSRTFAYSASGMKAAKEYARQYGGRITEANMKTVFAKKKEKK